MYDLNEEEKFELTWCLAMHTKTRLSREERLNKMAIAQEWMVEPLHPHPIRLVLLVALCSFAVGLLPVAYTLATGKAIVTNPTHVAGEAGLWSVLGEKQE